ncbi:SusC outer membrane protein [Algibacter lectus]|uniref:SusC outer membrane protein n=1 Tax=Algibacter lectus TaxID=221126 RepID=A0A090WSD7_9FLAO|nr:carboxypeptidase-like regulatory domain-containing protein [Algibacter lectus]GAL79921.1 SusC outer membrane protein [Algibacter lectus]
MEKLKLLLVTLLIGYASASWSQSKVSGVVTDSQNVPIPGVNVIIKGTSNGAATDFDGNFQLNAKSGDVITFSFIGFVTKELTYKGQGSLNVKLEEDAAQLDEVVVIGYGSVKRTDLTGAVESLDTKALTEQKKTDIGQAMQGRIAGCGC